jgi:predicted phosphodiesterase
VRLALTSDIHGNTWALEAVFGDIRRRGVEAIYDLGDVAQGSLRPAEAVAMLRAQGVDSVRGNTDRMLLASVAAPGYEADHALARGTLTEDDWQWLAAQPPLRRIDGMLLCHGTPRSDTAQLLETIDPSGSRLATEAEILARLGGAEDAALVACGHTHTARWLRIADGRVCVNPGSVGLQAFQDGEPFPHATQSGSPHARYAVVERSSGEWRVEHIAVPYDWESAARWALERGRPDRARWLRTGRASF